MDNLLPSARILLHKLVLVGTRKRYEVPFHNGLNIIYGDFDTGKSSILNLIDYCLGASSVDIYPQLDEGGKYCLLELSLREKVYTIKRDIFNPKTEIEVFNGELESIENTFPTKYYSNFSPKGELEYFSTFLLANLGFPIIKIKEAPSKADSKMNHLSFRDVFKFCYFNQDQVGSKDILNSSNFPVATKNREVFKYIFNIIDSEVSQLNAAIAEASKSQSELNKKHNTVAFFLRDTELKSQQSLLEEKEKIEDTIASTAVSIKKLNTEMISSSQEHRELRQRIVELDQAFLGAMEQLETDDLNLKNNILLKKEYIADIDKINASLEVLLNVHTPTEHSFSCPLCSTPILVNDVKTELAKYEPIDLEKELRGLQKRVRELDGLISDIKTEMGENQSLINKLKSELYALRQQLDADTKGLISPYVSELEQLTAKKASLEETKRSTDYLIKIRKTLSDFNQQSQVYDEQIILLKQKLALLESGAPKLDAILNGIGDSLRDFLSDINMKAVYGVGISSKTFLPILRDTDYSKITSGGVRTLVSVGYVLSVLKYGLDKQSNHPKLIMLDTIGKYLGKTFSKYIDNDTNSNDDFGITVGDKAKYELMYSTLMKMTEGDSDFQVLVVDNDLPEALEDKLQPFVIKHFDELGRNGLAKGFIDDLG